MVKGLQVLLILLLWSIMVYGEEGLDPFEGYWKTEDGNFILKIEKDNGNIYSGDVVWLKNPNFPKGDKDEGRVQTDRNNPNPSLRSQNILGLQIVGDLKVDGKGLNEGWIYDSWHGKKYYGSVKVENRNLLKLRGSIDRFGILGHSMKAYRVQNKDYDIYGLN